MKILHLTVKKKWFDLIASGQKKIEYREMKLYWIRRLIGKHFDCIKFKNGYHKNAPEMIVILKEKIIRMAITRDPMLISNVKKFFKLKDLLEIGRRMIGSGLIGGKSVGMLLAQAILKKS